MYFQGDGNAAGYVFADNAVITAECQRHNISQRELTQSAAGHLTGT